MKRLKPGLLALALCAGGPAFAQQMDHSKMDHSKMDHSKMDHSKMDRSKMRHAMAEPAQAEAPRTPIPVPSEADRAAAQPPAHAHMTHLDNAVFSYSLLDRLEGWDADPGRGLAWEAQGWVGTDIDRLWWHSEGERNDGHTEAADVELLYGRSISPWWDALVGLRHEWRPQPSRTALAVGVQGLAPQWFEVAATAYVDERGHASARFEVEYEWLFSNRLILQPRLEAELHGGRDAARGVGSGLATAEAGLRLRYEFSRQFAPYVGVVHERSFGDTAGLRRGEGEAVRDSRFVVGLRAWF